MVCSVDGRLQENLEAKEAVIVIAKKKLNGRARE
jgi:hypothetical protein